MNNETLNFRNASENPCNMCMPMGGILAFKGIEDSMVIIHGSQGCATYMRRTISEHYNEPVDVASSSLTEKGTVLGGEENLRKGLDNILKVYEPKIIGVLTTCLAETIGEDIERMTAHYLEDLSCQEFPVVCVPTPGYGGTHTEGYFLALRRIVAKLTRPVETHGRVNVILPHISPADIREIKRLLNLLGLEYTILPDFSDTLDSPYSTTYRRIPLGGTRLADIGAMGGAAATIELGLTLEEAFSPGKYLEKEYKVPLFRLPLPIGLKNTDTFIKTLKEISGHEPPEILKQEQGRLLDAMIDSHKHNFQGRAAIIGEPEQVLAVASICLENGVFPAVIATGNRTGVLKELLEQRLNNRGAHIILTDTDYSQILQQCRIRDVNLVLANSDGRYLTEKEGIPLVRTGFPIHDRMGGQRILTVGYTGTLALLDRITNTLLEKKYQGYRMRLYKKYYRTDSESLGSAHESQVK